MINIFAKIRSAINGNTAVPIKMSPSPQNEIDLLCKRGDELSNIGKFDHAINDYYLVAYQLIPEPKDSSSTALWIIGTIANAYFLDRQYDKSFSYCRQFLKISTDNPFIHLRYGQCALELQKNDIAKQELMIAYATAGPEIFYDDDPRYAQFLEHDSGAKDVSFPKLKKRN